MKLFVLNLLRPKNMQIYTKQAQCYTSVIEQKSKKLLLFFAQNYTCEIITFTGQKKQRYVKLARLARVILIFQPVTT